MAKRSGDSSLVSRIAAIEPIKSTCTRCGYPWQRRAGVNARTTCPRCGYTFVDLRLLPPEVRDRVHPRGMVAAEGPA
jgi:predicted Zn-ribbon and HTH transcriptional regulator